MELVLGLLLPWLFPLLALVFFGYGIVWGFVRRGRLVAQLAEEEPRLAHLVQVNFQEVPHEGPVALVMGNVAYGADAPSRWASTWRNLFGGRADSLTMQADMARRLATVRMLQQAQRMGAVAVTNIRYETSEIFSGRGEQAMLVIEMLAYGNALVPAPNAAGSTGPPSTAR